MLADSIGEELYDVDPHILTVGENVDCREGDNKLLPVTYALCESLNELLGDIEEDIESFKDETGELLSDIIGETDCILNDD